MLLGNKLLFKGASTPDAAGQIFLASSTFLVPDGVTTVCILGVEKGGVASSTGAGQSGGDIAWVNNLAVTAGETLTVNIASTVSSVLRSGTTIFAASGTGATTHYTGGSGGAARLVSSPYGDVTNGGSGGGSGTYTSNGSNGATAPSTAPIYQATNDYYFGRTGSDGSGITLFGTSGGDGGYGTFGSGEHGCYNRIISTGACYTFCWGCTGTPGPGAIRIIWGAGRAFPDTNVGPT